MSAHIKIVTNERGASIPNTADSPPKTPKRPATAKKAKTAQQKTQQSSSKSASKSCNTPSCKKKTSRITVRYNVGFGNTVYLRGDGLGLSWERGVPMRNIDANTWAWESDNTAFQCCSFKAVLNDQCYEIGENRTLDHQQQIEYTPHF